MKKVLIGLPVVAAVVFAGVPFMTGIVAEKKSKELIDVVNARSPQVGAIELVNYDRGLMSSDASYKYVFSEQFKTITKLDSIEYGCGIDHGVTGVEYACQLAETGEYKAFLDEFLGGKDPLSMTGNISAFGGIDQTVALEPVTITFPEGGTVSLPEKAAFTTEFAQGSSTYDFEGGVPKLTFEHQGSLNIDDISMSGQVTEVRDGLYVGDVSMKGKLLKADDPKGNLTLKDFTVDTSTKESGSTVSSSMTMNADSVEFPNPAGSVDSFSNLVFDAGIYGMDTDALVEYIKVNQELQSTLLASGDDSAQSQAALAGMSQLIPVAEKLLKKGLGMNMKSSFKSAGAQNDVALDLSLINDMQFNQMMGFLFSPDETLKNFKGTLNVDLKKEFLEKYPPLAITVSSIPLFVQTDEGVTLDVVIDSGLTVNGEQTTVAQLQGLFR